MGRTGNGTNNVQWIYVKVHIPYVWKFKIGITGYLWKRTRQTSAKVYGRYLPIAFAKIPFAWSIEQFFLNLSKRYTRKIKGKGGKEIRPWWVGLPCAIVVWILGSIKWLVILLTPFWLSWIVVVTFG